MLTIPKSIITEDTLRNGGKLVPLVLYTVYTVASYEGSKHNLFHLKVLLSISIMIQQLE